MGGAINMGGNKWGAINMRGISGGGSKYGGVMVIDQSLSLTPY